MKKQAEGVTEKILSAAEQEFLTYGFKDASLRRICAASGVSTHSLYTRFGDKEGLFDALVKAAADGLMEVYLASVGSLEGCKDYPGMTDAGRRGTDEVLEYVYQHFTAFQLIFCHSAGTKYADYLDLLSEIEERAYQEMLHQLKGNMTDLDKFFIHVVCAGSWQPVYEVVSHDIPLEAAKRFMELQMQYHYAGWEAVLGLL
ncbi:MAG: TetR/AcrR family transcriptional regulator [Lachnospiraceae bacterium]|nr:TetR/AcrR family transcriptional regulator [Lachnospiraceae bacterium]